MPTKHRHFLFYKNDDISHRALHVQLVSRIARNIGRMLGLDPFDLIEAVALGHDIGHTPFGHAGEKFLNKSYHANTGRYFNHNVHSVRVCLIKYLTSTSAFKHFDGILCHNGEFEVQRIPSVKAFDNFKDFDAKVEECYIDQSAIDRLVPVYA